MKNEHHQNFALIAIVAIVAIIAIIALITGNSNQQIAVQGTNVIDLEPGTKLSPDRTKSYDGIETDKPDSSLVAPFGTWWEIWLHVR